MANKPMIWISYSVKDPSCLKGFNSDLWPEDRKRTVDAVIRNNEGEPLGQEYFPKQMYAKYRDKYVKKPPDLYCAGSYWCVSTACAEVLRRFDLGQGSLYPVRLFQHNRTKPVEGDYLCLNFGNQKTAVLTDQSRRIRKPYKNHNIWQPPLALHDNDIAVSADALSGPDIWIDTQVRDAFFLSDALVQALRKAKVSRRFMLRKCTVL
ncbi:MAG: DUF1629 domain-containing protein [Pseudomonadota bacterium]